jgi:uncharacterized protein (DUF2141 family)
MKTLKISLLAIGIALSIGANAQNSITIKVKNVQKRVGTIVADLCRNPDKFMEESVKKVTVAIPNDGEVVVSFGNIPKGVYAVRLYQDVNKDGKIETGMFSIPLEPFGFSNNASATFGPPSFGEASFALNQNYALSIDLKKTID